MKKHFMAENLKSFLLDEKNIDKIINNIENIHPMDLLDAIHDVNNDIINKILSKLPNDYLALLLDFEKDTHKYALLMKFSTTKQKAILKAMSSDEITDLIATLKPKEKNDILNNLSLTNQAQINQLLAYPQDSAGSIMATEFISIRENKTVLKTLEFLQSNTYEADMAYYLYVTDKQGHLKGVLSLRDIISTKFEEQISTITNTNVFNVHVLDDQEYIAQMFEKYDYVMLPVVDDNNIIVGIITVDDIIDIINKETTEDIHLMAGLDKEEKIDGTLKNSIKSRLPWLIVNLITALIASLVVSYYSNTIQAVVALAAISPIITGMGGNAGNQSMTIVVRGIALNQLTKQNAKKIFLKELGVGIITGIIIGSIVGLGCYLIYSTAILGVIVTISLIANLLIATSFGFLVPIILKKCNVDPALASSIFVTTATDVLGFFIFLSLATICLPYLI